MALLQECASGGPNRVGVSLVLYAAMGVAMFMSFGRGALAQDRDNPARQTDSRPVVRRGAGQPILDGHGWMVLSRTSTDDAAGGGPWLLAHLPAREVGGESGSRSDNLEGVVREVGEIPGGRGVEGEGVAWWRNRVFLALDTRPGETQRRVLAREAIRSIGSFYEYQPTKQFRELPALPTIAPLVGMAATEGGPVVLVREHVPATSDRSDGSLRLLALAGERWMRVSMPWEGEEAGWVQLMSARGGVLLARRARSEPRMEVWVGRITQEGDTAAARWQHTECDLGELATAPSTDLRVAFVEGAREADDAIVGVVFAQAEAKIYQLRSVKPPVELSVVPSVPRGATVIPMASPGEAGAASGFVTFVWRASENTAERMGGNALGLQVREVSTLTGRVMYSGAAKAGWHAERPMVQWIVVLAMLAGVGALAYFLSSDPRAVPVLPMGMRPADPIRRLVAAMLDYVPSAILVALVEGRSALVMLNPHTLLGGAEPSLGNLDLRPLGLVIGVTILHASICEWMFGKSFGKFVMGVRVVSIAHLEVILGAGAGGVVGAERVARPGLGQALIRNVVRWVVPMLAVFGMLDVAGRHPGDLAARTLVVADPNDGK